jgi:hypothetical protein
MKRTFAERAKRIQGKYPNHTRSRMERESMMEELQALADEQEAYKSDNGITNETNTFRKGGDVENPLVSKAIEFNKLLGYDEDTAKLKAMDEFKRGWLTHDYLDKSIREEVVNQKLSEAETKELNKKLEMLKAPVEGAELTIQEDKDKVYEDRITMAEGTKPEIRADDPHRKYMESRGGTTPAPKKEKKGKTQEELNTEYLDPMLGYEKYLRGTASPGQALSPYTPLPEGVNPYADMWTARGLGVDNIGSNPMIEYERYLRGTTHPSGTTQSGVIGPPRMDPYGDMWKGRGGDYTASPLPTNPYQDMWNQRPGTEGPGASPGTMGPPTEDPYAHMWAKRGQGGTVTPTEATPPKLFESNPYLDMWDKRATGEDYSSGSSPNIPPSYTPFTDEQVYAIVGAMDDNDPMKKQIQQMNPSARGAFMAAHHMTMPEYNEEVSLDLGADILPQGTVEDIGFEEEALVDEDLTLVEKYKADQARKAARKEALSKIGDNSELLMAGAAAIPRIASNVRNLRSIADPSLIQPEIVRPSVKARWYDRGPMDAILSNQLASARTSLANRGGNVDDYLTSLRAVNFDGATARGQAEIEGQRINMAEQARIDSAVTRAGELNAQNLTQARIDQAQRQDNVDAQRRDYRSAIGENIGGVFDTISNAMLAKKVGAEQDKLATLLGYASSK